jgi:putative NADH-flavin reductase
MNLLLLGATGGTGSEVARQALARGHRVTAFVRSPDKVAHRDEQLAVAAGDPRDATALAAAAAGHDAVVSALGPRTRHDHVLMPACARSIVAAARDVGVDRVLIVSTALLFPGLGLPGAFFGWLLRGALRGAREAEELLADSDLTWTIARPVRLTNAPLSQQYRVANGQLPAKARPVARADVAHFLLDALEKAEHRRAIVGVAR